MSAFAQRRPLIGTKGAAVGDPRWVAGTDPDVVGRLDTVAYRCGGEREIMGRRYWWLAGQRGEIAFRPPYGKKLFGLPWYLRQSGRTTVMWDIEPESARGVEQTPEGITRHVLDEARPGSIILLHAMHEGSDFKLRALESMLAGLAMRGFQVVSFAKLQELCSYQPGGPDLHMEPSSTPRR